MSTDPIPSTHIRQYFRILNTNDNKLLPKKLSKNAETNKTHMQTKQPSYGSISHIHPQHNQPKENFIASQHRTDNKITFNRRLVNRTIQRTVGFIWVSDNMAHRFIQKKSFFSHESVVRLYVLTRQFTFFDDVVLCREVLSFEVFIQHVLNSSSIPQLHDFSLNLVIRPSIRKSKGAEVYAFNMKWHTWPSMVVPEI